MAERTVCTPEAARPRTTVAARAARTSRPPLRSGCRKEDPSPLDATHDTRQGRPAADDRDHQRKPERPGANESLRGPADAEPDRKWILQGSRVDALAGERSTVPSGPMHMLVFTDLEQEIELLGEERVVVVEVEAEQGEGLDE